MRRIAGFLILLGCVILGAMGCPSKSSSPSSPSAPTDTPTSIPGTATSTATQTATSTPTSSATKTATSTTTGTPTLTATQTATGTLTNTATQTATATITDTGTSTATFTITNTPTDSPTLTPSGTPTDTPTVTSTFTATLTQTPCGPTAFQSSYNFSNGNNCWNLDAGSSALVTSFGATGSLQHNGNNSYQVTVNNTSGSTSTVQIEVQYNPVTNLCGYSVTVWAYVDSSLYASGEHLQVFDQNTGFANFEGAGYGTLTGGGTWIQYIFSGMTNTNVFQFGVQLSGIPSGQTGSFYIADVAFGAPPTPLYRWNFSGGTVDSWAQVSPSASLAVTDTTAFPAPCSGSTNGLDLQFTGTTGMDILASVSGGPIVGSGMNWTALGITTVKVKYYINAGIGSFNSTFYPFVVANGNNYGGTYQGYTTSCNNTASCSYVGDNTWQTVTYSPSGGSWTTDKTNVTAIGVNPHANSGTAVGDYVIGEVDLY